MFRSSLGGRGKSFYFVPRLPHTLPARTVRGLFVAFRTWQALSDDLVRPLMEIQVRRVVDIVVVRVGSYLY